ncbi:MAG: gluconate 2-dehydrogenase subunit 3 family protein [Gammaproteobacteria bacterium]|nr:gluconate 2-dehydrogenase subunit 3 family protein [Gammaproteobacteria bacterium]
MQAHVGAAAPESLLTPHAVRVLGSVLEGLLPGAPEGPGARDINATGYVLGILAHPRTPDSERHYLREGLLWLDELTPAASFETLTARQREEILRSFAASERGEAWLANLLGYVFEALFGDPAYGGNPGGVGWRWIEHQPGFPHPTPDKVYGKL